MPLAAALEMAEPHLLKYMREIVLSLAKPAKRPI
jgi:hypothetical protein